MLAGKGLAAAAVAAGAPAIEDVFSTDLYTGNGSTQTITNGIDLAGEGGLVWIKNRTGENHGLVDTEVNGLLFSNLTNPANTGITHTFNNDGFTVGSSGAMNDSPDAHVSWTFRKAPRFFDVVTYAGNGVAGREIAHNLGVTPGVIIIKSYVTFNGPWVFYNRSLGATQALELDSTGSVNVTSLQFNDTEPTDSSFTVGSGGNVNSSGSTYVAYLFAHDTETDGVVQCGGYTGNGSSTGPTISLGWEPQWLMIKRSDSTGDWWIYDSARDATNPRTVKLLANSSAAEDTSGEDLDFTATGFQPKTTAAGINASGGTYTYIAIRAEGA